VSGSRPARRVRADSLVFRQAFSVYGATGLSEPSIWAGSHLLHMQYVKPFAPLNHLEKLVEAENYRRFVTQDVILTEILKASTVTDPLDAKTAEITSSVTRSRNSRRSFGLLRRRIPLCLSIPSLRTSIFR